MKKIILSLLFLLGFFSAFSQNSNTVNQDSAVLYFGNHSLKSSYSYNPKYTYCRVWDRPAVLFSSKIYLAVDFGQPQKALSNDYLKNEAGDNIAFNSIVEALNYLSNFGWELFQTYTDTSGGNGNTSSSTYYLLRKEYSK